jgi:hypothetical protein
MTTAWAHLPNAACIDRILADIESRPEAWLAAWDAERAAARDAVRAAVRDAARAAAWDAARAAAWDAARDAILALITWDDCAYLLSTEPDHVRVMALLGHPPAVLLLPAVIVWAKNKEVITETA